MTAQKFLIFGGGGHAKSVFASLTSSQTECLVGFVSNSVETNSIFGFPVFDQQDALGSLVRSRKVNSGFVAVGDNTSRSEIVKLVLSENPDFLFTTVIDSSARVSRFARIDRGTFIGALASVGPDVVVSQFCIINTLANLEHDSSMGEFSSIGPNAAVAGKSELGPFSVVAINATILQRSKIGAHSIVGAGSLIASDVPEKTVFFGEKATFRKQRTIGDSYL